MQIPCSLSNFLSLVWCQVMILVWSSRIKSSFYFLQWVIIHYCTWLFWHSDYSGFDPWKPLGTGFRILVRCPCFHPCLSCTRWYRLILHQFRPSPGISPFSREPSNPRVSTWHTTYCISSSTRWYCDSLKAHRCQSYSRSHFHPAVGLAHLLFKYLLNKINRFLLQFSD